jgi:hypothetical protein
VSRDPRAEARLDVRNAADNAATDAYLETLVVPVRTAKLRLSTEAQPWLEAAAVEDHEDVAVRFWAYALGAWDMNGVPYLRATPDDVAAALTEWYLARGEVAA